MFDRFSRENPGPKIYYKRNLRKVVPPSNEFDEFEESADSRRTENILRVSDIPNMFEFLSFCRQSRNMALVFEEFRKMRI